VTPAIKRLKRVLERAEVLCRERGVRFTEQRKTVLRLVCASDKPISAYELLDQMRGVVKNPAPPTVYRALDFLLEQGLVHKLESLHAYVGCTHPDHPHASQFLICEDCGEVTEVEDVSVAESLRTSGQAIGFRTKRPIVEVLGTCARCDAKQDRQAESKSDPINQHESEMPTMSLEQTAIQEARDMPEANDKIAVAIEKLNSQLPLQARQQALPPALLSVHRAILRTLAEEGRTLTNDELANLVGADGVAAAIERLGGDDLVVLDADKTKVLGAYPMTTEETIHHLKVNGRAVNAICALDAVVVGPMYDAEVAIESRCQVTGEPVRVHQQGDRILSAEPSADVRVGVRWQQPGACAAHSMCLEMVFLKDGDTARRWVEEGEGDKTEFTLDEAVAFGASVFVPLVK